MYWALIAVILDQILATLSVRMGWAHPEEQRFLGALPYWVQAASACVALILLWKVRGVHSFILIAGFISNVLSKVRFGYVPDYLVIGPFYSNGADLLISIGAIWLIASIVFKRERL